MSIVKFLELPELRGKDLDNPSTAVLQRGIIGKKGFLRKLYTGFYRRLAAAVPGGTEGKVIVEVGSGPGFIKEVIPNAVTSDIMKIPGVDRQFSALKMPFRKNSVDAYLMLNTFHHVQSPKAFLREIERTLKHGGRAVMIEHANTPWGGIVWRLHFEPFDPSAGWGLEKSGPLSSSNCAMPWIVFCRDRERFGREFPSLRIVRLEPHTPFSYLISGGLSFRQFLPSSAYGIVEAAEALISPLNKYLGMFQTIEIEKA